MSQSMMDKYGRVRIRQIVAHFYGAVLQSPQLAHYFDDVDVQGLVDHQTAFLTAVMGGPHSHDARHIEAAHQRLDVTGEDFDEMIRLLERSLDKFEIEPDDIDVVSSRYDRFRDSVVVSGSEKGR